MGAALWRIGAMLLCVGCGGSGPGVPTSDEDCIVAYDVCNNACEPICVFVEDQDTGCNATCANPKSAEEDCVIVSAGTCGWASEAG